MRTLVVALSVLAVMVPSAGCKKKSTTTSADAATLSAIFADSPDAAPSADPSASAAASTDEPLPSLKHVDLPPPVIAKPKPTTSGAPAASTAAAPAGNAALPQCVVARAFCKQNRPECEAKKAACLAAGGTM